MGVSSMNAFTPSFGAFAWPTWFSGSTIPPRRAAQLAAKWFHRQDGHADEPHHAGRPGRSDRKPSGNSSQHAPDPDRAGPTYIATDNTSPYTLFGDRRAISSAG